MIQSLDPSTATVLRTFEPLSPEAVETKLALAASAARSFRRESLEHREFWMRRLSILLAADREELATLIVIEVGKTLRAARQEVDQCIACCDFYRQNAERILESEPIPTENLQSYVRWEPMGILLAVMPWNDPLWQVLRCAVPALMAGNVLLLKHAPGVPQCALAIEALVRRAGFPRGTLQTLLIENDKVESVIADPRIAAVTLTGSEAAGRAVAAQAGYLLKKSVLELGGSDPFIVMPSANLEAAIRTAAEARCLNNGQSCIAAKRFLVHTDVYEAFERGFVEAMQSMTVGDPMLESTDIGPLFSASALDRHMRQMEAALAAGGRLLTGGKRILEPGFFAEPTVIAGMSPDAAVAKEETLSPLALLFKVSSLEEAITLANGTPFGLGASCWTLDRKEQDRLTDELEAGSVFFNRIVASDPRLPFGGTKQSGFGRELSAAGMREFLNAKTVVAGNPHTLAVQLERNDFMEDAESARESQPAIAECTELALTRAQRPLPVREVELAGMHRTSTLGLSLR